VFDSEEQRGKTCFDKKEGITNVLLPGRVLRGTRSKEKNTLFGKGKPPLSCRTRWTDWKGVDSCREGRGEEALCPYGGERRSLILRRDRGCPSNTKRLLGMQERNYGQEGGNFSTKVFLLNLTFMRSRHCMRKGGGYTFL